MVIVFLGLGRFSEWVGRDATHTRAGFGRGMLHGAAMPLALPKIALGSDVAIYANLNAGRSYNLGYTLGVNLCGALFFGVVFLRVGRWRQQAVSPQYQAPQ